MKRPATQMHLPFPASPITIWSVEIDAIQVVWGSLPAGDVTATCAHGETKIQHIGGAGGLVLTGLQPDTTYSLNLRWSEGSTSRDFRTATAPPGQELTRFATISDLHLGAAAFGFLHTMKESKASFPAGMQWPPSGQSPAYSTASSAMKACQQWGADRVVIKGDIAHHRSPEAFSLAWDFVDQYPDLNIHLIPGNHDVDDNSSIAVPNSIGHGAIPFSRGTSATDLPGIRLITTDTTTDYAGPGTLATQGDNILELAQATEQPVFLAAHHHLQKTRIPLYWPPGIPGPQSNHFLDTLARANHRCFVSSGHTHRNHVRHHGPLAITQVASTRDWPGVWAGYRVFEGGIAQIVRRIDTPGDIHWLEYTKDAVLGAWRFWASGSLDSRSFVHNWQ